MTNYNYYLKNGNFILQVLAHRALTRKEIIFAADIFMNNQGLKQLPKSGLGIINYTL